MTRISKYGSEIADRIVEYISLGYTLCDTAYAVNVSDGTIQRWRDRYPDFNKRLVEASNRQWERHSKLGALSRYKQEQKEEVETYKAMTRRSDVSEIAIKASKQKMEELQANIVRLEGEIEELTDKIKRLEQILLTETEFLNLLENAPQQMRNYDFVGKDALLRSIFLNLQIDKQNKASFLCKPEFDSLIKSSDMHSGGSYWASCFR